MNSEVEWLRDEAEFALLDGRPVIAGRLQNAADEIERLQARVKELETLLVVSVIHG